MIKRALISVSDKTNLVPLAESLTQGGVTILASGGTYAALKEAGIAAIEITDYTGFPEIMGGRVKTLHPKIYGGILGRHQSADNRDAEQMKAHQIEKIDLVIVNLYPFQEAIQKPETSLAEAIENIDIGGPTLIRAAAKNHQDVAVLTDPNGYPDFITEWKSNGYEVSAETRFNLACQAFQHTAAYDAAIANYFSGKLEDESALGPYLNLSMQRIQKLRYGENPHQQAAFYRTSGEGLAQARQLHGKALSYNNINDAEAALSCVNSFEQPACVIVKHANPCGVALSDQLSKAYQKAYQTDPTSAFGGIIAFNRPVDGDLLKEIFAKQFSEVIIAPAFEGDLAGILQKRKAVRLLAVPQPAASELDYRTVQGGLLVQQADRLRPDPSSWQVVTKRSPSTSELADLTFAWQVAKFVKSNAMVLATGSQTIGIGAGQMSRVDSSKIALMKAAENQFSPQGAVLASDAFLPFRDGLDLLAEQKVRALIQPGGSVRDQEVVEAANENDMAMVFTAQRHFRH